MNYRPIGIFDSGFGGLTVLKEIEQLLPQYDFLYLGDNARAPYGNRSFEIVYEYTIEMVQGLFHQGCPLVIIACNTASAKALRTIQQNDIPRIAPEKRVLGVIRPVTECIGAMTQSKHVGILATAGTVASQSYAIEINKFFPEITVIHEACPIWVPLIENNEFDNEGADYFIKKHVDRLLSADQYIDTVILGCTHYPLIQQKIRRYLTEAIQLVSQGEIVAKSLVNYLDRHPEIANKCTQQARRDFYSSETAEVFDRSAAIFYGSGIHSHPFLFM
jgi:glutamate racemase